MTKDDWEQRRYSEAMQTFRSTTAAVVPAATALLAGTIAIIGVAVSDEENVNCTLLALGATPMIAMGFLFDQWRWFLRTTMKVAEDLEGEKKGHLSTELKNWMGTRVQTTKLGLLFPETDSNEGIGRSLLLRAPFIIAAMILATAGLLAT